MAGMYAHADIEPVSLVQVVVCYIIMCFHNVWPHTVNMCCPRMVSGRRTCCVCERVLGSGAAMVIEALSLCFHLACFQVRGHDRVKVRSQ